MLPCLTLSGENGRILVWLPGQGQGLHGGFSMLNTSDSPNGGDECLLSSVLETTTPLEYCLSAGACKGILNRAANRGKQKTLPEPLALALKAVAASELISSSREYSSQ